MIQNKKLVLDFFQIIFSLVLDTFRPNNPEKGYPFGKLRVSEDGKNEELIPSNDMYVNRIHCIFI